MFSLSAALGGLPATLAASLKSFHDQGQRWQALKEAMAVAAQKLLSGPEDHVGELKTLLAMATNQDMQVSAALRPKDRLGQFSSLW